MTDLIHVITYDLMHVRRSTAAVEHSLDENVRFIRLKVSRGYNEPSAILI